ncbi:MAG: hypothetical protein NZM33_14920 [Bryobacteraceae bacterium]|nr:hypothetical protein [Bryobacteraceae bacterium]
MTIRDEALERAKELDIRLEAHRAQVRVEPPKRLFSLLRAYLHRYTEESGIQTNVYDLIKIHGPDSGGLAVIELGPQIDKGPTPEHFSPPPERALASGSQYETEESILSSLLTAFNSTGMRALHASSCDGTGTMTH